MFLSIAFAKLQGIDLLIRIQNDLSWPFAFRITLIAVASIVGSTVVMAGFASMGILGLRPGTYIIVLAGTLFDVLLDTVCVVWRYRLQLHTPSYFVK